jgi:hypothetical protein
LGNKKPRLGRKHQTGQHGILLSEPWLELRLEAKGLSKLLQIRSRGLAKKTPRQLPNSQTGQNHKLPFKL